MGKGIKGLVANSTIGITNSISKISGTLYLGLKGMSGVYESESNLENPQSIQSGIIKGAKGLVVELGNGFLGVVAVPSQRINEQGFGVGQLAQGTAQGIFGLVTCPFNGAFKLIYSVSTGLQNFAKGRQIAAKRLRFPRYIDEREVMRPYQAEFSHAFNAIRIVLEGKYKNEAILSAYDVSSVLGKHSSSD